METLRVVDIVEGTSVDGPGLRTSIYFAGCKHQCPGCHNQQTWDFEAGHDMTIDELMKIIDYNGFNVTFSGGDPLYQADKLVELAKRIKTSGKTIWCYTGFTYEQVINQQPFKELLQYVDVLVDGPYIEAQRNTELRFRGSENQRLIDIPKSKPENITFFG